MDYVASARVAGRGRIGTMVREILPNVLPTIVVLLTLEMGIAVIVEAILSFVNLSISTDDPTWGGMIAEGRDLDPSGLVGAGLPADHAVPDRPLLLPAWRRAEGPLRPGAAMSFLSIRNLSVRLKKGPPLLRRVSLDVAAGEVRGPGGRKRRRQVDDRQGRPGHPAAIGRSDRGRDPAGRRRPAATAPGRAAPPDRGKLRADPAGPADRAEPQPPHRAADHRPAGRHPGLDRAAKADARARELLAEVQIPDPDRVLRSYPHELSGGMRQRILIASAFAAEPKLIVADEPTTALDVTVQKQILKLIAGMQARHGTALLFVTHDLGVVSKVCQKLSVLYAGHGGRGHHGRRFLRRPPPPLFRRPAGRDAEVHRPRRRACTRCPRR